MRTLQLYGAGAATANAVAQITIPTAGRLKGVQVSLIVDCTADNSRVLIEYSKVATGQFQINSGMDPFLSLAVFANTGAAGFDVNSINQFFPLDVDVRQGELIYLHANVVTAQYYANAVFYF